MSIFNYQNYKAYLQNRIALMPKKGRGEVLKIAHALSVHPTLVSQVLKGSKDFTIEQSQVLAEYLGLTSLETDYFLTMIQTERAGTAKLKKYYRAKLSEIRERSLKVSQRVTVDRILSYEERARFYSDWIYSAIRLQTSIEGYQSPETIAQHFDLPRIKVSEILNFLVACGLCEEKNGAFSLGAQRTVLEHNSPFLKQHHANWRLKSLQKASSLNTEDLMFTAPMSISRSDFQKLREELTTLITKTYDIAKDSPAQQLACLNIDWFAITK